MTDRAAVVQVARLPFLAEGDGASPIPRLHFTAADVAEVNWLLSSAHYLGPIGAARYCFAGWVDDVLVAAMVWRWPTARLLPSDGTWLELSRWCLTPEAGRNAGSKMMRYAVRCIHRCDPGVTTLVSYSDPSVGHTGALYKASGWEWAPTHHRLAVLAGTPYPTGNGTWDGIEHQEPKDRWLYRIAQNKGGGNDG